MFLLDFIESLSEDKLLNASHDDILAMLVSKEKPKIWISDHIKLRKVKTSDNKIFSVVSLFNKLS